MSRECPQAAARRRTLELSEGRRWARRMRLSRHSVACRAWLNVRPLRDSSAQPHGLAAAWARGRFAAALWGPDALAEWAPSRVNVSTGRGPAAWAAAGAAIANAAVATTSRRVRRAGMGDLLCASSRNEVAHRTLLRRPG